MRPDRLLQMVLVAGLAFCPIRCAAVAELPLDPQTLAEIERLWAAAPARRLQFALAKDDRVHYEHGAESYAEAVAKVLPRAITKIEAVQDAPFGHAFIIEVYADDGAYAAVYGEGGTIARAGTFFHRVMLSPRLWRDENLLEAYLTHELSHEYVSGHLSALDYYQIPDWFSEGLAVMVSDGGGAHRASTEEAKIAIGLGYIIATPDVHLLNTNDLTGPFSELKSPAQFAGRDLRWRYHMAYRQAGLFVAYLRDANPLAFKEFLHRLFRGEAFKSAFEASFGSSVALNWGRFAQNLTASDGEAQHRGRAPD